MRDCVPRSVGSNPTVDPNYPCGEIENTIGLKPITFWFAGATPVRGTKYLHSLMNKILDYDSRDMGLNPIEGSILITKT